MKSLNGSIIINNIADKELIQLSSKKQTKKIQFKNRQNIEQSYGLCGRGRGWEDLGEWH